MLEVVEPGLHSTIQDAGRAGWGHLGVRRAGAADPLALVAANLLVGNAPEAPAIEMTLLGGTFAATADLLVGLAGADMEASVAEDGRGLVPGRSYHLRAGSTLVFGGAVTGARAYLAVAGGIDAPVVLGSAATDPIAGFGGIHGRVLQAGDVLPVAPASALTERRWPSGSPSSGVSEAAGPVELDVVRGPHLGAMPSEVEAAFVERTWTVSPRADRVGLRLDGQPLVGPERLDLVSMPMVPGAIQVPPNGLPIVLMPDAPTVGGYPVVSVIAEATRHRAGQLRPGDELRFRWIAIEQARRASAEQQARLAAIAGTWA